MDRADLPGTSPGEGVAAGSLAPGAPGAPASAPEPATQAAGGWRDQISVEVKRLAEIALAQALEAVVAGRGPITPFVVLDRPGGRVLGRFEGEPGAALERARAHVRASDAERAAVAWAGCITVGGVRQDAVVITTSDRGRGGVVVAHRYRETVEGAVVVGRPVLVGPGEPVL